MSDLVNGFVSQVFFSNRFGDGVKIVDFGSSRQGRFAESVAREFNGWHLRDRRHLFCFRLSQNPVFSLVAGIATSNVSSMGSVGKGRWARAGPRCHLELVFDLFDLMQQRQGRLDSVFRSLFHQLVD